MFVFNIKGGTKKQKSIVDECAFWCMKKLLPRVRKMEIDFHIKNLKSENVHGYCLHLEKNHYEIEIDNGMNLHDFVATVCHEMVHVRQYYSGQLSEVKGYWKWQESKDSDPVYYDNEIDVVHHEDEATALEDELTSQFLKQMNTRVI